MFRSGGHIVMSTLSLPEELNLMHQLGKSRRDQGQASQEAEDRPQGCTTLASVDAGRQLSADLGAGPRESGSAEFVTTLHDSSRI
jgi:hypothetical protein